MPLVWTYEETRDCEIARVTVGDMDVTVTDYDGDLSEWEIKKGDHVVASGSIGTGDHFSAAQAAAWAVLPLIATR